jgi:hypothetical protein
MKPGKITHTIAALLSSISSLFAHGVAEKAEPAKIKLTKKSEKSTDDTLVSLDLIAFAPRHLQSASPSPGERYPWKRDIVTTVFWIGETPTANNPVPNRSSSWDKNWARSYGGFDDPNPVRRQDYVPVKFTPRQNPFYCALPYNDKAATGHRPEASRVVPWFNEAYQGPGISVCKAAGLPFAKETESPTRNGKMPARFAPTIGSTFSATSVRSRTSTKEPASMFRRQCGITSA